MTQVEALQDWEPLATPAQTLPHAPQLLALLRRLISQPSACLLPLQSAKPALHVPTLHEPPAQLRAMLFCEHWVPHAPQLVTSEAVLLSQPSASLLPLQSEKPALQAPLHVPLPQEGL